MTEDQAKSLSFDAHLEETELKVTKDGKVQASDFSNYCTIFRRDPYLRDRIRFNLLNGRPEGVGFFWNTEPHPIDDNDLRHMRLYVTEVYGIGNEKDIKEAVDVRAWDNKYNPVETLLKCLEWDGVERIHNLFPRYLGAERSEYVCSVADLIFAGAIQRILRPGIKFDYCPILADSRQGTGKSTICRLLALRAEWFTDSISDLSDPKRAFEGIRGKWVVELGELLAVRRAKDIESTKAFITRQADVYRDPYGIYAEDRKRQCIFIGTTNAPRFLPEDKTGNRRFLPIICDGARAECHPMSNEAETAEYIRQCYAEAMAKGLDKVSLVLDPKYESVLDAIREEATPEDVRVGEIQNYLDGLSPETEYICTKMVWDALYAGDYDRQPKPQDLRDIADILTLKITGWERYEGKGKDPHSKKRFKEYGTQRAWVRKHDVGDLDFIEVDDEPTPFDDW